MSKLVIPPKQILVFNARRILIAIAASITEASRYGDVASGNLTRACKGDIISLGKYYYRYIDDSIEIGLGDLGTLTLEEYDELCGVKRPFYTTTAMSRLKMKNRAKRKTNTKTK